MTRSYEVGAAALDPRPGDVVVAELDDSGWQVLIIEEIVAQHRLLPMGDRGSRAFITEDTLRDSTPPAWRDEVQLLVTIHAARFASAGDARSAVDDGHLERAVPGVCIPASSLLVGRSEVHSNAME